VLQRAPAGVEGGREQEGESRPQPRRLFSQIMVVALGLSSSCQVPKLVPALLSEGVLWK
jgi:hypothetical protein